MIRRYLILSAFALQTLVGCSYLFPVRLHPEAMRAETLIDKGKNKEAATIYQQLADSKSEHQNYYRLLAADAFIRGNEIKKAQHYITLINVSDLKDYQRSHLNVLQAQIQLSEGKAEQAIAQLKEVQPNLLKQQTKPVYYQSLAFAYSLIGNPIASAQALIDMEPFIYSPSARYKHYRDILTTLNVLSKDDLHLKQPLGNPTLNGWMALTRVFKLDAVSLDDNLTKWKKAYPVHSANSAFLNDYVKNYYLDQSGLIAVFLPESGIFAEPAAVIKAGFMKAHQLAKKQGSTEREIRFYDTASNSVGKLYKQAVQDGARLIVGPLDKKDINSLVNNSELTVPVLALNHVEGLSHAKLYQFALTPLDDAEQVTLKAYKDGYQNALFLVPRSEQGKRFAGYFSDNWQKLGGKVVKMQSYDDSKTDFSDLISQIMPETPAAPSIDSVILNAYAKPAQLLYPNLKKTDMPVYATAQVYLGDENSERDKKLDGLTFCDVPWVFPQAYAGELSKQALYSSWESLSASYMRLLPMGIDAYQLISQLSHLKNKPYNGATGKLRLDSSNRVTRELFCAKFEGGIPKAINYASEGLAIETTPAATVNEETTPSSTEFPSFHDELDVLPATNFDNAVTP